MSLSSTAFLDFDFDRPLVLDFAFDMGVIWVCPASFGIVPLFGPAWGFGVALLRGVDEALVTSGGLDVL
jgi:hypothetical protein